MSMADQRSAMTIITHNSLVTLVTSWLFIGKFKLKFAIPAELPIRAPPEFEIQTLDANWFINFCGFLKKRNCWMADAKRDNNPTMNRPASIEIRNLRIAEKFSLKTLINKLRLPNVYSLYKFVDLFVSSKNRNLVSARQRSPTCPENL